MRVGIIGAGPAGLTAAYQLQKSGLSVDLYEAGPEVGGMARSLTLWGHRVDLGPHRFFSKDSRVNTFWHDAIEPDYHLVERQTRIFYRGRFFAYPLQPLDVLAKLGPWDSVRCIASYLRQKIAPERAVSETESFEDWVVARFGRRLYAIFFKSYSEKLWGIPCDRLDADFAAQRIRGFSLGQSLLAMSGLGARKQRTLVDCFSYPDSGSGAVYSRIAEQFQQLGGRLHLNAPVSEVIGGSDGRVLGISHPDGRVDLFDHVVSTMPLTLLAAKLAAGADARFAARLADPLACLQYRNTILVYLKVEAAGLFPDQWIYIHAPDLAVGRITNFSNWGRPSDEPSDSSVLCLEYWCYDGDAIWREPDDRLTERAIRDLKQLALTGPAPVTSGHVVRVPRCYPVYGRGYQSALEPVIDYLKSFVNLWPIGRYGSFKYNNQDHSILMGLLVAENIANGAQHDLWAINTDYDEYQEDGGPVDADRDIEASGKSDG
jgi:protoporphyrinogen oxidase